MTRHRKSAIVFDLDGTLLNTLRDLADSVNAMLERFGYPTHPLDDYRMFVGEGAAQLVERALPPEKREADTVRECLQVYGEIYDQSWSATTVPYPGVPELLDALTHRQRKLTILTNKPDDFTQKCVSEFLGRWKFELVLGQRENIPRKPDPAGAREVIRQLNVPPEEFLYLGDSGTDMRTANAAGLFAVGALWGYRAEQELLATGAQALISQPIELLKYL